jgi:hypothetical protein
MNQRSIALYLNRKGWTARVIQDDLVATLGGEAIAYGTLTKYLREAQTGPDDATQLPEGISPHIDDSPEVTLSALEEFSFSSVQYLFYAIHLRCVPQILSDDQKAIPMKCSRSLRTILLAQETRAWHDTVTLDESWF